MLQGPAAGDADVVLAIALWRQAAIGSRLRGTPGVEDKSGGARVDCLGWRGGAISPWQPNLQRRQTHPA
jgi:hypothetical protein